MYHTEYKFKLNIADKYIADSLKKFNIEPAVTSVLYTTVILDSESIMGKEQFYKFIHETEKAFVGNLMGYNNNYVVVNAEFDSIQCVYKYNKSNS